MTDYIIILHEYYFERTIIILSLNIYNNNNIRVSNSVLNTAMRIV